MTMCLDGTLLLTDCISTSMAFFMDVNILVTVYIALSSIGLNWCSVFCESSSYDNIW